MKKLTIELMRELATQKGGECLSEDYINAHSHLKWSCAKGHQWFARPMDVRKGKWCKLCANKEVADNQRGTIEEMREIAAQRGGKCLSKEYITARSKLEWVCAEGHRWRAIPDSIKRGSWCSRCTRTFREELCRTVFEQIFNAKFEKWAPAWLKTRTGNQMYIDGYSKKFNLAFEYQGEQHTKITQYSETQAKLKKQKTRDRLKRRLLKKNNIHLVTVSYRQNLKNLPQYIERRTKALASNLTDIKFDREIDFNKVYLHKTSIEQMQQIASKRNGRCLSVTYINARTHLKWECEKGHRWKATPDNVKRGTWCKKCYKESKDNILIIAPDE